MVRFIHPTVVRYLNSGDEDSLARFHQEFEREATRDRVLAALVGMFAEGRHLGESLAADLLALRERTTASKPESEADLEELGERWFRLSRSLRAISLRVPRFFPSPLNELFVISKNIVHGGTQDLGALIFAVRAVARTPLFEPLADLLQGVQAIASDGSRRQDLKEIVGELQERCQGFRDPTQQRWDHFKLRFSYLLEEIRIGLWTSELEAFFQDGLATLEQAFASENLEDCLVMLDALERTIVDSTQLSSARRASNLHSLLRLMQGVYAERIPKSHLQAHLDRMRSLKDGFEEALLSQDDEDEELAEDFDLIECGMLEVQAYLDTDGHDHLRSAYEQILAGTLGFLERRSPDSEVSRIGSQPCLHCGEDNMVGNKTCSECGALLLRTPEEHNRIYQLDVLAEERAEALEDIDLLFKRKDSGP